MKFKTFRSQVQWKNLSLIKIIMEFSSSFLPFILLKSPTHEAPNMCLNLNFYYIPHQPLLTPSDRCKQM